MSKEKGAQSAEVTKEQLHEAEQGLIRLLFKKRFSREWIDHHVPEAMAQAQADLAARIAAGREDETVGLLVVIAYRRALKALRAEKGKPRTVPLDEVFDLGDDYARTPEQIVMDTDRQARLLAAMRFLPERDRQLLGLVYYGELDVKAAGHRLGWSSSSADRHHKAALRKLRAVVGERSLLGVDVAVPALVASNYAFPSRGLHHWLEAAGDRVRELAGWFLQRTTPIAEAGSAVGMSGAGRTTAGVCGLAVAACMAAVTSGVVGPGVAVLHSSGAEKPQHQEVVHRARPAVAPPDAEPRSVASEIAAPPTPYSFPRPGPTATGEPGSKSRRRQQTRHPRRAATEARPAPRAAPAQATTEFGVEAGGTEALPQPAHAESPPPASPPPRKTPPAGSGGPGSDAEFGM